MAILEWDDSFSLGIPIIDKQHQTLFVLLDNLLEGSLYSEKHDLDEIFRKLYDYTDQHFAFEEKIFNKLNYQFENEHQNQHEDLKASLKDKYEKYKNGTLQPSELMEFLLSWISGHITLEDKKYAEILRDKIIEMTRQK